MPFTANTKLFDTEQPKRTFAAKSSTFCWRLERILACSESFVSSSETSGLQITLIKVHNVTTYANIWNLWDQLDLEAYAKDDFENMGQGI